MNTTSISLLPSLTAIQHEYTEDESKEPLDANSLLEHINSYWNPVITNLIRDYLWRPVFSLQIGHCFDPHTEVFLPLNRPDNECCSLSFENFSDRAVEQLTANPRRWYYIAVIQDTFASMPIYDAKTLNTWLLESGNFLNPQNRQPIIKIHYFVTKKIDQRLLSLHATIDSPEALQGMYNQMINDAPDTLPIPSDHSLSSKTLHLQPYIETAETRISVRSLVYSYCNNSTIAQLILQYAWQPLIDISLICRPHEHIYLPLQGEEGAKISELVWRHLNATPSRWCWIAMVRDRENNQVSIHDARAFINKEIALKSTTISVTYFYTKNNLLFSCAEHHGTVPPVTLDAHLPEVNQLTREITIACSLIDSAEVLQMRQHLLQNLKITSQAMPLCIELVLLADPTHSLALEKSSKLFFQNAKTSTLLQLREQFSIIISRFEKVVKSLPNNEIYALRLSDFLFRASRIPEARRHFIRAVHLNPTHLAREPLLQRYNDLTKRKNN